MGRSFEKMAMPEKKLLFAQDVPKVLLEQFLKIDILMKCLWLIAICQFLSCV